MAKTQKDAVNMLLQNEEDYQRDSEALTSFIRHHLALFVEWFKMLGAAKVFNDFSNPFESYLQMWTEDPSHGSNEALKRDLMSRLTLAQQMEVDLWSEMRTAFRELQTQG